MADPLITRHVRAALCLSIAWLAFLFTFGWLPGAVRFVFILTVMMPLLAVPAVLAIVIVIQGVMLASGRGRPMSRIVAGFAAPAIFAGTLLVSLPTANLGRWSASRLHLSIHWDRYREAVEDVMRKEAKDNWRVHTARRGLDYLVDEGPPVRIAFEPDGILDNWTGIVFDPTGEVILADGFDADGRLSAPLHITRLFGGDLVRCSRLRGDFYICAFT